MQIQLHSFRLDASYNTMQSISVYNAICKGIYAKKLSWLHWDTDLRLFQQSLI